MMHARGMDQRDRDGEETKKKALVGTSGRTSREAEEGEEAWVSVLPALYNGAARAHASSPSSVSREILPLVPAQCLVFSTNLGLDLYPTISAGMT